MQATCALGAGRAARRAGTPRTSPLPLGPRVPRGLGPVAPATLIVPAFTGAPQRWRGRAGVPGAWSLILMSDTNPHWASRGKEVRRCSGGSGGRRARSVMLVRPNGGSGWCRQQERPRRRPPCLRTGPEVWSGLNKEGRRRGGQKAKGDVPGDHSRDAASGTEVELVAGESWPTGYCNRPSQGARRPSLGWAVAGAGGGRALPGSTDRHDAEPDAEICNLLLRRGNRGRDGPGPERWKGPDGSAGRRALAVCTCRCVSPARAWRAPDPEGSGPRLSHQGALLLAQSVGRALGRQIPTPPRGHGCPACAGGHRGQKS